MNVQNTDNVTASSTVLITGGSSGLGRHCARELLSEGRRHVVITSPDATRARRAAEELANETGNSDVSGLALQLDALDSVRAFAVDFTALELPPLTAIVCNAAVQLKQAGATTADGIERIFGVNHLGHFLLVNLLAESLQAPARVVFVSSSTHDPAQRSGISAPPWPGVEALAHPDWLQAGVEAPERAAGWAYAWSKLCNLLTAYELDRRLRARGLSSARAPITVNAFDPGLMPGTSLARDQGSFFQWMWRYLLPLLRHAIPGVNSPQQSGRNLACMVKEPALGEQSARYVAGTSEVPSSVESRDETIARELWEGSERLVGLHGETLEARH